MKIDDQETAQWLMLFGAILCFKDLREQAGIRFSNEEVPEQFRPMWSAIRSGSGPAVWAELQKYGVERPHDTSKAFEAILESLMKKAMTRLTNALLAQANFAKGLMPDDAATLFESMALKIRTRQAAIEKLKKPEGTV